MQALKLLFSSLRNGDRCWNGRGGACVPARTSAQRRFHTKDIRIMRGNLTMDAPLWGDTGGHTGTAPTKLHHTFLHHSIKRHHPSTCNPPIINGHFGHVPAKITQHLEMNERKNDTIVSVTFKPFIMCRYSDVVTSHH